MSRGFVVVVMTQITAAPAFGDGEEQASFDGSQFKLQPDGTFKISIRGMAGMAGIESGSFSRSLKSAAAENPLPCARYLVAQGFSPAAVSSWGETGGIPEEAAPFILNHYGMLATAPSDTARLALLAFSRVGINAYLKEKLGIKLQGSSQEQDDWAWRLDICQRIGIEFDERDKLQIKEAIVGQKLLAAGATAMVYADIPVSRAVQEVFDGLVLPLEKLKKIGMHLKRWYRQERGADPVKHDQYVDGANRSVNTYPRDWIMGTLPRMAKAHPELFSR